VVFQLIPRVKILIPRKSTLIPRTGNAGLND
jgi:hypothetical protein